MRFLRQNTATRITVGPFLDVTNGYAAETGLTATNEALTFIVDTGGVPTLVIDTTATASGGDNDLVHITNDNAGYYDLELTAAQTNYLGRAILTIQYDTDHRPVTHEFTILPANVYDSLILGSATDLLQVDVTQLLGTAWLTPLNAGTPDVNVRQISEDTTAADNMEKFFDGTGYAGTNNVIPTVTESGLSAAAVDAVWDEPVAAHTTVNTYGSYIDTELTSVISGVLLGTGTLACTYTLTLSDNGMPISGARVIVSTDGSHVNIVASGITNQYGIVPFNLDAGTVYLWRYKSGVNFSNPIVATFSDLALDAVGTGTLVETESSSRIRKASFVGSS